MNDQIYNKQTLENLGRDLLEWVKADDNHWFIKDWFIDKGIPYSYHKSFISKSKDFKESLEKATDIMESRLVKKLIDKGYATQGMQFLMKQVLGWKDTNQLEVATVELNAKTLAGIKDKFFKKK